LALIKDVSLRQKIRKDIVILQLASSPAVFDAAKVLFLKKWSENQEVVRFLDYFTEEYLNQRSGWYEGKGSLTMYHHKIASYII